MNSAAKEAKFEQLRMVVPTESSRIGFVQNVGGGAHGPSLGHGRHSLRGNYPKHLQVVDLSMFQAMDHRVKTGVDAVIKKGSE